MCTEFSEIFQMHVNIVYTRFWLSIINYREMDIQYYLFLTNGIQNVKKRHYGNKKKKCRNDYGHTLIFHLN